MGNYLKFFEKESDYDIFKESDDFILPNISYTDDTETLHFNTLFIEPEKPKVTLKYNATADNLLALNNSANITTLKIDGTNVEFEPLVSSTKTIDVIGSQIQFIDEDNMIIDCPLSFFIDSPISEWRVKAKDPNAAIMGIGALTYESGTCIISALPMEWIDSLGITIDPVTNEFIMGMDMIGSVNNMMPDALASIVLLGETDFLDTENILKTTTGGLETPYYFASEGEHVIEIETESGVFGGANMFAGSTLYNVTIGDEITAVEENTFADCTNLPVIDNVRYADTYLVEAVDRTLSSYTIKNGTKWIGPNAFSGCTNWADSLSIPNTVIGIGLSAFEGCSGLTGELVIPNSVTHIGSYAFSYCYNLTGELIIPTKINSINMGVFQYCTGLTGDLIIPNSVISIGTSAFDHCRGLTSLSLGNKVTSIGSQAFSECENLTGDLIIPNSVTSIGMMGFLGCAGLTSVALGYGLNTIGMYAFCYCTGLIGELVIPNSITSIGEGAFIYCYNLTSLVIPESVIGIGDKAFGGCAKIERITSYATTAPSITSTTFLSVKTGGILYYPSGSDYSSWLSTEDGYLGSLNWIGETF